MFFSKLTSKTECMVRTPYTSFEINSIVVCTRLWDPFSNKFNALADG